MFLCIINSHSNTMYQNESFSVVHMQTKKIVRNVVTDLFTIIYVESKHELESFYLAFSRQTDTF